MRQLYLLRGNVASGKSTWLREQGFTPYTLCADVIRVQIESPVLKVDGKYGISQKNDKKVWALLFDMLEARMERGELVFIDAVHSKTSSFSPYRKLAQEYRYRIFGIDFTDISMEECKHRNRTRDEYKYVPEAVLDNLDSRLRTQAPPSYVTMLDRQKFQQVFKYSASDFNEYQKIYVIGDIHGCMEPLEKLLIEGLKDDTMHIFVGDFIDRGIQNAEVVKFLLGIYAKPNVILLEGNHERWLRYWADGQIAKIRSNEFLFKTMPQLDQGDLDKKEVRQLCRKLSQVAYFVYQDKYVLVTHAGISRMPNNLSYIATEQFIKGVGKYEEMKEVADAWEKYSPEDHIQIAGHRNVGEEPCQVNSKYYNLEGKVEEGGRLRNIIFTPGVTSILEIPNTIFRPKQIKVETTLNPDSFVEDLRNNRFVRERQFENISSFNFTPQVFFKGIWNGMTIKARGLFVNTKTNEVVARSYNKFFNIGEKDFTKLENLKFEYPVQVYVKYNGFLGMLGYDSESDSLLFCSKSSLGGPYADLFERTFREVYPNLSLDAIKYELSSSNTSLVFEVIHPDEDPHIIKYHTKAAILLDIVRRTLDYEKLPFDEMKYFAELFKIWKKVPHEVISSHTEFLTWYKEVSERVDPHTEGFVLEDSSGFMVKLKLPYYHFWRYMRTVKDAVKARRQINLSSLTTPEANEFYSWLKDKDSTELEKDIITLRDEYYDEKGLNDG